MLIVGKPGSGKGVLGYNVADAIHGDRPVYVPMSRRYGRPGYYRYWDGRFRDDSVYLISDASISYHARRWSTDQAVELSMLQSLRRHRNVDLIWDTQNVGLIDTDIPRHVNALVIKEPSVLQSLFERPQIKKMFMEADAAMGGGWSKKNAYAITDGGRFKVTGIPLPGYWCDDISRDDQSNSPPLRERVWGRLRW